MVKRKPISNLPRFSNVNFLAKSTSETASRTIPIFKRINEYHSPMVIASQSQILLRSPSSSRQNDIYILLDHLAKNHSHRIITYSSSPTPSAQLSQSALTMHDSKSVTQQCAGTSSSEIDHSKRSQDWTTEGEKMSTKHIGWGFGGNKMGPRLTRGLACGGGLSERGG